MFASNLRKEFAIVIFGYSGITKNFLLNNSDISIPTLGCILRQSVQDFVSIVSIQADQSRPIRITTGKSWQLGFNRINSGRSIPTGKIMVHLGIA